MTLTLRQQEILKAIIEEYIETAQPVASVELVQKRGIPLSGATVRNIMALLVKQGYLQMPHISAGRQPTERAYRYYLTELMDATDLSVIDEMAIKQKIWETRYELEKLLRNTAAALSEVTNTMALAMTSDGYLTYAGSSRVLEAPEFYEIDVARSVFRLVDDFDLAYSLLDKNSNKNSISVLIGREIGLANMDPVCMISSRTDFAGKRCYTAVIGPSRMQYNRVIPIMRHTAGLLDELSQSL